MIGIAGFIFKIYRDQLNARRTISEQKNELQNLHDEQTSSIRYAKKIQEAVLPSKNNLSKYLPDHFVFYLPRDIVSGDFYWAHKTPDGHSIFAVADCTGHGVPGAFMSMIGHSLLNEIIITRGITDPARALNDMRTMIISSLHQKGEEGEARDGMDIALCILSPDNKTLRYSGAFNSLYIIRESELMETKADPQPIGFYADDMDFFTNHEIELHKNDCIYIFSDGYPDQFGGPKGKKYMYKPFKAMLKKIHIQPMELQADLLKNEFIRWRGEEPQIDDVCILGVKV
jgi:serine phosphatase RsbU (regulator of sigma subunit)